ncbi:MAG: hypothetical protein D3915_13415, partial [Candidatus Electrothrix sp. AU1_5]|nr:hypothetical protein [Candidatus Electrothrix gigas]
MKRLKRLNRKLFYLPEKKTLLAPVLLIFLHLFVLNTAGFAEPGLASVKLSTKPLDLSRTPTTEELMAAGQLGGQLFPTADITVAGEEKTNLSEQAAVQEQSQEQLLHHQAINLSFGKAIQAWNKHEYKEAVGMFEEHLREFPDSPWAAESALHIGCDARYSGRYTEATDQFNGIIEKYKDNPHEGAKRLVNKAKLRLANVKALQNNFPEAKKYFRELIGESDDWRSRTYGSHWLQRLSRIGKDKLALLNCGMQALAVLLEQDNRQEEANAVRQMRASSLRGQSLEELQSIAAGYGYPLTGLRLAPEELVQLPLPAILQLRGDEQGDSGHYWILEQVNGDLLALFDPQNRQRFNQSREEFAAEWDGIALVFGDGETGDELPGVALSLAEMQSTYGGCCGVQRPESNLGNDPENNIGNDESPCGKPVWSVNAVNLNLFVRDVPIWYSPAYGPSVSIALSYNSQSATDQHEPFGNKWQFNYGSFLTVDSSHSVLIFMPDGRRDLYVPDGAGGYTRPYKGYNTLTKIAENHFELRFPDDTVYVYNIPAGTNSLQPYLVEIRDAYDQKISLQYNSDVQLTTITDAQGKNTVLTYNAEGRVTQVADPFGRTALFEYDDNCNPDRCTLTKITDMGGYWSTLSYNEDVYLTEIGSDLGAWQFYIEPTSASGAFSPIPPAPGGQMWENYRITVTNPLKGKEEYYYNGYSNYSYSWHVKPHDYIPWQSREINNYALGVPKTRYYFTGTVGERGEISSIRYPEGNTITYTYDPSTGERTNVSDSAGNTIQYTYNDMGRVTSITDAKGTKTDFTYSTNNVDLIQVSNGLGTVNMTYNGQHDLLSITDRLNTTTAFTYNDKGQRTSMTEAKGVLDRVTDYNYDPTTARLKQIAQGSNVLSSYTYDPVGRVKTSTDATGLTLSYAYNDLNYLTRTTYPDNKFSEKIYSSCCPGMVTSETDRAGKTTSYIYDALKRRVKTTHPDGAVTRAEYDANGNLITLLDSNSNATRFSYDLNDRLIKKTYADGKSEELVYNNLGQLEQQLNGRGIAVTYAYDSNYNLLSVAYSDDTPGVTYQYDAYNRLIEQQDGIGLTTYSYDANSRVLTIDGPWDNDTLTYQYDVLGRRTGVTPQSGTALSYSYDTLNRLTQIESNSRSYTYAYNGINPLVQSLTRPNGSSTAYLYDSLNRLTSIANKTSANAILTQHVFTYNDQDLRGSEDITRSATAASPTAQLFTYQYNALNQLLEKADPAKAFVYDADGNMTQGYTPDGYSMTAVYAVDHNRHRKI